MQEITHFYLCQEKSRNLACISNKQVGNKLLKCFFIGVAIKLAVLVSWHNSSILALIF